MCGRFVYLTYDEVADVIRDIEAHSPLNGEPDWPAIRPNAYPSSRVPLIKTDPEGQLFPAELQWGFEAPWQQKVVFNTRVESGHKPFWRDSLAQRRCIVPALSFFEPHKTEQSASPRTHRPMKRPYEFFLPDHSVLLMAALWKDDRFSILTTAPNASVAPIHDRMPLVLRPQELPLWLSGDYEQLFDRSSVVLASTPELPLLEPQNSEQLSF